MLETHTNIARNHRRNALRPPRLVRPSKLNSETNISMGYFVDVIRGSVTKGVGSGELDQNTTYWDRLRIHMGTYLGEGKGGGREGGTLT